MDSVSSTPALDALALQLLEEKVSGPREWGVGIEVNPMLSLPSAPPRSPYPHSGEAKQGAGRLQWERGNPPSLRLCTLPLVVPYEATHSTLGSHAVA